MIYDYSYLFIGRLVIFQHAVRLKLTIWFCEQSKWGSITSPYKTLIYWTKAKKFNTQQYELHMLNLQCSINI